MRTLTFNFIADSRFGKNKKDIEKWDKELKEKLPEEITLDEQPIRKLVFGNPEPCISFRKRYFIRKFTRKITWNNIYEIINSVRVSIFDLI